MSKSEQLPKLRFASRVTREAAERFVDLVHELVQEQGVLSEAFGAAEIIEWPDVESNEFTPAQERYFAIEKEIVEQAFAAARPVLAQAFLDATRAVLARERRRQR